MNAIDKARAATLPSLVLPYQRESGVSGRGDAGNKGHAHEGARRQSHAITDRGDGVEHGTGGPGQGTTFERHRVGGRTAAAEKSGAIGLPFNCAAESPLDPEHMKCPDWRLIGAAWPAAQQNPCAWGIELCFDEQFPEGGVREVVLGAREHDLGVTGHLDFPWPIAPISDR